MNRRLALLSLLVVLAAAASAQAQDNSSMAPVLNGSVKLYLFWRDGCPHCEAEREFLGEIQGKYPELAVFEYEVGDKDNQALYLEFAKRHNTSAQYVPATFIGDKSIMGFNNKYLIGRDIENAIRREIDRANNRTTNDTGDSMIYIPFVGEFDPNSVSLPVLTVVLGGMDSVNPCAFFILLFLLSLMVHAQSRTRMFIIGGIFVFFSGLIYFLFMAAWLNLFLVIGQVALITTAAGLIALVIGGLNVKEFYMFKQGPSLTIPDSAKPKLFERMRNLVKASGFASMVFGTAVLAIAANSYELLCTMGFPLVFTRVLTLNHLSVSEYYLYIAFYNVVYVLPLFAIVLMFTWTLGSRKLKEEEGRLLKLLSGIMMFLLGILLVIAPEMLNNILAAGGTLIFAVALTAALAYIDRMKPEKGAEAAAPPL